MNFQDIPSLPNKFCAVGVIEKMTASGKLMAATVNTLGRQMGIHLLKTVRTANECLKRFNKEPQNCIQTMDALLLIDLTNYFDYNARNLIKELITVSKSVTVSGVMNQLLKIVDALTNVRAIEFEGCDQWNTQCKTRTHFKGPGFVFLA